MADGWRGTKTGRFSSRRSIRPQDETIDECILSVIHGLTNNGTGGLKELQHQPDTLTFPIMLSVVDRLSDLAHLFGWERLVLGLKQVHQQNKHLAQRQQLSFTPQELAFQAVQEQEVWVRKCGSTLEGYIAHYGDPGMERCFGNGGAAIYAADCAWLNTLRLRAGITPRDGL